MGWKMVRDRTEANAVLMGVTGTWRVSEDPAAGFRKKLLEEIGEYVENLDPAELYDVRDVLDALICLEDPDCIYSRRHGVKLGRLGYFDDLIEWSPMPGDKSLPHSQIPCDFMARQSEHCSCTVMDTPCRDVLTVLPTSV